MSRLLLSILLLFLLLIPVLAQAQTSSCVVKEGCPKGVKPPACCKAPPCEFYEQMRNKRAVRNLFANKKVKKALKKKAGGDNKEAAKMLYDFVVDKAKHMGKYIKCQWQSVEFPPTFETNDNCQITAMLDSGAVPMSQDTALNRFKTCSEFIKADYAHEQSHKDICFKTNSVERQNQGLDSYAQEEMDAYQKELDALKADLQDFWGACSSTADASTARKLAKLGVDTLKKKSSKKS